MPLALFVLVATIAFALSPLFVPDFGGFEPGQFPVPQEDPPVQPAGYAFSIWGIIYLWLLVSAGFGVWRRARAADWVPMRAPLVASVTVGAAWLPVAKASPVYATVLIWVMLATALAAVLRAPSRDYWLAAAPVGLFAGWLSAASVVALGLMASGYGLLNAYAAGLAGILLATGLGCLVQLRLHGVPSYGVAVVWALIAVAVRNAENTVLMAAALTGAALVTLSALRAARR